MSYFSKNTSYTDITMTIDNEGRCEEKLQKRMARFAADGTNKKSKPTPMTVSVTVMDEEEGINWSDLHIIGTCQDIAKPFFRLTTVSMLKISIHVAPNKIKPRSVAT